MKTLLEKYIFLPPLWVAFSFKNLWDTSIDDSALDACAQLSSLQELNLIGTAVTISGIKKLAKLPCLKMLNVAHVSLTPEDLRDIRSVLPGCEVDTGWFS